MSVGSQGGRERFPMPAVIRSRLVLELASEFVNRAEVTATQALVTLRRQGGGAERLSLFAGDSPDCIAQVQAGEIDFGMVNPSAVLTVANRGVPPFRGEAPVRVVAVIPSADQLVFAVGAEAAGKITCVEDLARRRPALELSLRGQRDHGVQLVLDHVVQACGFSLHDVRAWGGALHYDNGLPNGDNRLGAVAGGGRNAIFDEAANRWVDKALSQGMRILPLREETLERLESWGYRRTVIAAAEHPLLGEDVPAVDFSGWPLYVRADAPDAFVVALCEALVARQDRIPWQGDGPLPLAEMCADTAEAPFDVPLHDAAARYWASIGYRPKTR